MIIGQQLRKGVAHSARGADKVLADALGALKQVPAQATPVVVRADSAYYGKKIAASARRAGEELSVTVRLDKKVKKTIPAIEDTAWKRIQYNNAIYDETTDTWISQAEVAEVPFTAFSSKKEHEQVTGRLVVRRVPEKNTAKLAAGQDTIFDGVSPSRVLHHPRRDQGNPGTAKWNRPEHGRDTSPCPRSLRPRFKISTAPQSPHRWIED